MKKQPKILPLGPKGYEINERMKELMGISAINENQSKIVVELTKVGPDGKAYAIVRENHEWFIKKASKEFTLEEGKSTGLLAEDFKYIGGLANKHSEGYPSYAKAIKHLNLKFKSLAEAYNFEGEINVFANDNLISEAGIAGFTQNSNSGFSGKGNLEGNDSMTEEEEVEDEPEMSEAEQAIDKMLDEEETEEKKPKYTDGTDVPKDTKIFLGKPKDDVKEHKLSIAHAMKNIDAIIDGLNTGKKKVYTLK